MLKSILLSGFLTFCFSGQASMWSSTFILQDHAPTSTDAELIEYGEMSLTSTPNPFNPTTVITVKNLSTVNNSSLCIYDVKGSLLVNLSHQLKRGNNSIIWNASHFSTGIYILRLRTSNGKTLNSKIILVR